MKYVLAIDQSTQGTKAMLVGEDGRIACCRTKTHRQLIDGSGFISHDADEIYSNVVAAVKEVLSVSEISSEDIVTAGIANQRETTVLFCSDGALAPAVVWQCSRSKEIVQALSDNSRLVYEKTGLPLSPYFSAGKMAWLLKYVNPERGFMLGTMDTYLLYRLTGRYVTDTSNASRTQLMNLKTLRWDEELLSLFGLRGVDLPEIVPSNGDFGLTDFDGALDRPIPITAVMGDSQAALYGQGCVERGDIKATYGTGSSVMMNIGELMKPVGGLSLSAAWNIDGKTDYVLEGNINYSMAVIGWLQSLGVTDSPSRTSDMAKAAHTSDTTVLIPAFSGLSAPYWRPETKASITGLTRLTGRNELVRAALQSVAFQVSDVIDVMMKKSDITPRCLRADGGGSANDYLMQFQSDITRLDVTVPNCRECSAYGAAKLAGRSMNMTLAVGEDALYRPVMKESERESLVGRWQDALNKL